MDLEKQYVLNLIIKTLLSFTVSVIMVFFIKGIFFKDITISQIVTGIGLIWLLNFVVSHIFDYLHWLITGRSTYINTIKNQLLSNGYPKFKRDNEMVSQYLKSIYNNDEVDTDVRLNACTLSVNLDVEKSNGVLNFFRKLRAFEKAIDSYSEKGIEISTDNRPIFELNNNALLRNKIELLNIGGYADRVNLKITEFENVKLRDIEKDQIVKSGGKIYQRYEIIDKNKTFSIIGEISFYGYYEKECLQKIMIDSKGGKILEPNRILDDVYSEE